VNEQPKQPAKRVLRLPNVAYGALWLALIGVVCAMSGDPSVGRNVVLGRRWPASEMVALEEIDHGDWDLLLQRFVDESGNVAYSDWSNSRDNVEALDSYLASIARANPRRPAARKTRLAFWINAYNALMIRGILREYSATRTQDRAAPPARFDMWSNLLLRVGGTDYSLDQIENQVLRPLREPRIHFAIVCGSRGCPRLRNRAYSTSDLERQLQDNARNFFADPQKLEYDPSTGELRLSPILKWYAQDFGNSEREVLETITPYLPDRVTREGRGANRLSAGFLDYDWSLNAQAAPAPPIPPNAATASPENRAEEPH
jgi:hypothetical protein